MVATTVRLDGQASDELLDQTSYPGVPSWLVCLFLLLFLKQTTKLVDSALGHGNCTLYDNELIHCYSSTSCMSLHFLLQ